MNRRLGFRYTPYGELALVKINYKENAFCKNISNSGCFLEIEDISKYKIGQYLNIWFEKDMICLVVSGKIVRAEIGSKNTSSGIGIKFTEESKNIAKYVANWVKEDSISYVLPRLKTKYYNLLRSFIAK